VSLCVTKRTNTELHRVFTELHREVKLKFLKFGNFSEL
jgi:hypothetical protein